MNKAPKVIPLWDWVYVKKLENHQMSKGGIHLPDKCSIPNFKARVLAVGDMVREMNSGEDFYDESSDLPFDVGDIVILYFGAQAQPIEVEEQKEYLLVPANACIAKIPRGEE